MIQKSQMRKIIILSASILLFLSCSNESTQINPNQIQDETKSISNDENLFQRNNNEDLKLSYESMIASESYGVFDTSIKEFYADMNFDGDLSIFNDERSMFTWISSNLSKTNFSDLGIAEARWEKITDEHNLVIAENEQFFTLIQDIRPGDLVNIYPPLVQEPNGGCLDNCDNEAAQCTNDAFSSYMSDIEQAHEGSWYLVSPKIQLAAVKYTAFVVLCVGIKAQCIGGCL